MSNPDCSVTIVQQNPNGAGRMLSAAWSRLLNSFQDAPAPLLVGKAAPRSRYLGAVFVQTRFPGILSHPAP